MCVCLRGATNGGGEASSLVVAVCVVLLCLYANQILSRSFVTLNLLILLFMLYKNYSEFKHLWGL